MLLLYHLPHIYCTPSSTTLYIFYDLPELINMWGQLIPTTYIKLFAATTLHLIMFLMQRLRLNQKQTKENNDIASSGTIKLCKCSCLRKSFSYTSKAANKEYSHLDFYGTNIRIYSHLCKNCASDRKVSRTRRTKYKLIIKLAEER